jgi:hypothetical protein
MFQLLMAVGLLGAVVWVIAHAIFLLLRHDGNVDTTYQARNTVARFVEENYGSRFGPDGMLQGQNLRGL